MPKRGGFEEFFPHFAGEYHINGMRHSVSK